MRDKMFTTPLIKEGITKTNCGEPIGLLNWMIHNREVTNAKITSRNYRIANSIVRPSWLNVIVGSTRTQVCDIIRSYHCGSILKDKG